MSKARDRYGYCSDAWFTVVGELTVDDVSYAVHDYGFVESVLYDV